VHQRLVTAAGAAPQDRVVLVRGQIEVAGVVGLQAVGAGALVTLVDHRVGDRGVVERPAAQGVDGDAVEPPRSERAVVEALPVVGDRDAGGAHRDGLRLTVGRALHQVVALHHRPEGRQVKAIADQLITASRSRHACSQARHASAHTRQCSCMPACDPHSSPQDLQAVAQASRRLRLMFAS
jgi:hypothetical protein